MHWIITILFYLLVVSSCSTRVAYERSVTVSPFGGTVNINTVSADELEKLPGIGRKTAESIVEFRTANGPFRRVEHLMLIRGVSERRFTEIRPHLRLE